MKILRFTSNLVALAVLALGFTSMANAQATRTWVSGVGDDANPCSRTAPCKTFAGAISKTAPSGEIDCLDPGGFGAVTITKSITINCDAGPGGILPGVTNAININGAGIVVTLRALDLQGVGQGVNGVNIISAQAVHLVDMNIYGFTGNGVNVAVGATVFLSITDTHISECANGIVTNTTAGAVAADIDHVSIWNTGTGINAQNGSRIQVHNSTSFNNNIGVNQTNLAGAGSTVTVFQCFFTDVTDLQSIAGASIGVAGSVFSGGGTVFNQNGGLITSTGDNVLNGNGATGALGAGGIFKM
jgi:hypothetical protein